VLSLTNLTHETLPASFDDFTDQLFCCNHLLFPK
jgi:hypothetical protein